MTGMNGVNGPTSAPPVGPASRTAHDDDVRPVPALGQAPTGGALVGPFTPFMRSCRSRAMARAATVSFFPGGKA